MKTYPLESISLEEAMQKQFKLVDEITKEFKGSEFLNLGDLGVVSRLNKPEYVKKCENVLARFFDQEDSIMVQGAGTGAIRFALLAIFKPNDTILVHDAAIYPTSKVSIDSLGLKVVKADFNDLDEIRRVLGENTVNGALVQYTRQKIDDSYDMEEVIRTIKECQDVKILTDDNYAALKVRKIGVEAGADLSCFSAFKLQGPEGVGIVTGKKELIDKIEKLNYSGGSKVQGWQANEVLRAMTYAPVALAIQAQVNDELVERLNNNEIEEVKGAFLANAQSKVLLVEFKEPIAEKVLEVANEFGGAPNPIGAESKYELAPMIYRLSATFRETDPELGKRMIRINPMRSSADTIIRILKETVRKVK